MTNKYNHIANYKINILFVFILCCYILGLFIPILRNDDSVLYATISKNMILAKSWFLLYHPLGIDWLDKPHFPYWFIALSFYIFGVNSFSYVLIGLLFNLFGVYYTYKLALLMYYDKLLAKLSALILLSSFHIYFSSTIDIRAEVYLLGTIIPSIYYLYKLVLINRNAKNLLLSSLFLAFAIMTKGVFTLITVYSILLPLILSNKFYSIIKYIAIHLICTIIFITPELLSLYLQFNINTTGCNFYPIYWFLWDSQFGRFFNSGAITRKVGGVGHYFFYIHTYLWSFLPWSIASIFYIKYLFKNWYRVILADKILLSGFISTFILFSLSKFQLDYYINILLPFISILMAKYLLEFGYKLKIIEQITRYALILVLFLLVLILLYITITNHFYLVLMLVLLVSIIKIFMWNYINQNRHIITTGTILINAIILLIFIFYRFIYINYEGGYNIAKYINHNQKINTVIDYKVRNLPLEFYSVKDYRIIQDISDLVLVAKPYFLVIRATDFQEVLSIYHNGMSIISYNDITIDKLIPYLLRLENTKNYNNKLFLIKVEN